jgi:hypothetical protein
LTAALNKINISALQYCTAVVQILQFCSETSILLALSTAGPAALVAGAERLKWLEEDNAFWCLGAPLSGRRMTAL